MSTTSTLSDLENVVTSVLNDVQKVPGLGGVVTDVEWILQQIINIGRYITQLETIINTVGIDLINVVIAIVGMAEHAAVSFYEALQFVILLLESLLPVLDPASSNAQRTAALGNLNPFNKNGKLYHFINDPSNNDAFHVLIVILVVLALAVIALTDPASLPLLLSYVKTNTVDALVDVARQLSTGIANGESTFKIVYKLVLDWFALVIGVPIGPATALVLTYQIISGLPIPPVMALIDTIAADPVAQRYIGKSLHLPATATAKVMPVAIQCLNAADASQWFNCLSGVIEVIFPKIITDLNDLMIDVNDLRSVVQAAWETGGDPSLMFGVDVSSADTSSDGFSGTPIHGSGGQPHTANIYNVAPPHGNQHTTVREIKFTSTQSAAVGIGFFGIDTIAKKIGIKNADGFFINSITPLLPQNLQDFVQSSYDTFRFTEQFIIESGHAHIRLNHTIKPVGLTLYVLKQFHAAQWDVEIAMSQILVDEFDPNNTSIKFFSALVPPGVVTPALKVLITKLALDYPRLGFMLQMLLNKLQIDPTVAIGDSSTIDAAQAVHSHKIPRSGISARHHPVHHSSSAAAAEIAAATPTIKPLGTNWAELGTAAASGFILGGPAGALLGAGATVLFGK